MTYFGQFSLQKVEMAAPVVPATTALCQVLISHQPDFNANFNKHLPVPSSSCQLSFFLDALLRPSFSSFFFFCRPPGKRMHAFI